MPYKRIPNPVAEEAQKIAEQIELALIKMLERGDELMQDRAKLVIECARLLNLHKMLIAAFLKGD